MNSLRAQARTIGVTFEHWLADEVKSSGQGNNAILDNYDDAISGIVGGWDHPKNFGRIKHESHVDNRMPLWWAQYEQDPENDLVSAKLLFNGLMQISGAYRTQCYLQARGAQDYLWRRSGRPVGINLESEAMARLINVVPGNDLSEAEMSVEDLGSEVERVSRIGETALKNVSKYNTNTGRDLRRANSPSVQEMAMAQHAWARFSIDCVIVAAKIRGGELAAVPFLEPKSISLEPQVIYPMAA